LKRRAKRPGRSRRARPRRARKKLAAEQTVSVATAARLLGLSRRTILHMLEDGRLEGTRERRRGWWKVHRAAVARMRERKGTPV